MVAESEYRDSDDLTIYAWSPYCTPKQKGYLSSCVKKGFIEIDDNNGDPVVCLTSQGIKIYNLNK